MRLAVLKMVRGRVRMGHVLREVRASVASGDPAAAPSEGAADGAGQTRPRAAAGCWGEGRACARAGSGAAYAITVRRRRRSRPGAACGRGFDGGGGWLKEERGPPRVPASPPECGRRRRLLDGCCVRRRRVDGGLDGESRRRGEPASLDRRARCRGDGDAADRPARSRRSEASPLVYRRRDVGRGRARIAASPVRLRGASPPSSCPR